MIRNNRISFNGNRIRRFRITVSSGICLLCIYLNISIITASSIMTVFNVMAVNRRIFILTVIVK